MPRATRRPFSGRGTRVPDARIGDTIRQHGTNLCPLPECRRAMGDHFLRGVYRIKRKDSEELVPNALRLRIECPPADFLRPGAEA